MLVEGFEKIMQSENGVWVLEVKNVNVPLSEALESEILPVSVQGIGYYRRRGRLRRWRWTGELGRISKFKVKIGNKWKKIEGIVIYSNKVGLFEFILSSFEPVDDKLKFIEGIRKSKATKAKKFSLIEKELEERKRAEEDYYYDELELFESRVVEALPFVSQGEIERELVRINGKYFRKGRIYSPRAIVKDFEEKIGGHIIPRRKYLVKVEDFFFAFTGSGIESAERLSDVPEWFVDELDRTGKLIGEYSDFLPVMFAKPYLLVRIPSSKSLPRLAEFVDKKYIVDIKKPAGIVSSLVFDSQDPIFIPKNIKVTTSPKVALYILARTGGGVFISDDIPHLIPLSELDERQGKYMVLARPKREVI